jgi:hypothetical protein
MDQRRSRPSDEVMVLCSIRLGLGNNKLTWLISGYFKGGNATSTYTVGLYRQIRSMAGT